MLNLKKLAAAAFLTCTLVLTVWADCPDPGIMGTPPCIPAAQPAPDDSTQASSTAPGIMGGPPAAAAEPSSVELTSFAEIAMNVLMLF